MKSSRKRLIEDFLPLEEIGRESQREKNLRHGHISTLHQWWSRKPLVASRAAIYATLLSAPSDEAERSQRREELLALSRWEMEPEVLEEARERIRTLYPDKPPRVLDPFAGGGSIPLEALRLGCEVFANDLNPVAYLIELCTLVFPQRWGDELAQEAQDWGGWVRQKVFEEIGDLYPSFTLEELREQGLQVSSSLASFRGGLVREEEGGEPLRPEAYLWTRTVVCPNLRCQATVPLLSKSWLCKRKKRFIALAVAPASDGEGISFSLLESCEEGEEAVKKAWGFDPAAFSRGGNTTCLHCGAAVGAGYVREQGREGELGMKLMAIVCTQEGKRGKRYIVGPGLAALLPLEEDLVARTQALCEETGLTPPDEDLPPPGSLGIAVRNYGFRQWKELFTPRQLLSMLTFCKWVQRAYDAILQAQEGQDGQEAQEKARALVTYLALGVTKLANRGSSLVMYNPHGEKLESPISNGRMSINWDVAETNPLGSASGNFVDSLRYTLQALRSVVFASAGAKVMQGPAQWLDLPDASIDAVVTDPPYYDNVPYSTLSDYFYIWLKRILQPFYPESLLHDMTPKRRELVVDRVQFQGDGEQARKSFEDGMQEALTELHRVLVPHGPLVVIYAHKTTAGWATLIDALRRARFVVTESWPVATERPSRLRAQQAAALASSVFLVARKRELDEVGEYRRDVLPRLREIVTERIETLFGMGMQGADLVLACVGAGLLAFTRYVHVELPGGRIMQTEQFLQEIQREVVEQILTRVMQVGDKGAIANIDPLSQLYVMTRFQFGEGAVHFDEVNILARGLGVELSSGRSVSDGKLSLVQKREANIRLRSYDSRGMHPQLVDEENREVALIDWLHRLLWLSQEAPDELPAFFASCEGRLPTLRLLAQALAGSSLSVSSAKGSHHDQRTQEQRQIDIVLAAWPKAT